MVGTSSRTHTSSNQKHSSLLLGGTPLLLISAILIMPCRIESFRLIRVPIASHAQRWRAGHQGRHDLAWDQLAPVGDSRCVSRTRTTAFCPTFQGAVCSRRLFGTALSSTPTSDASDSTSADATEARRVVFLGTPDVAAATLQSLFEASQSGVGGGNFEIVSVVTQPPRRRKRKGSLEPSPVGKMAEDLGIPVWTPEKAKDPDFLQDLAETMRPDLCITAAYGQYLPKKFLATPVLGTVNLHPSLLPRWRGASPVQRSLEAGDNPVGVTILYTVSKMDAGPIVAQQESEVGPDDTAVTVLPDLFALGTKLLIESLPKLWSGEMTMETATPQDEEKVVQAPLISAAEAELKVWEESALVCHNRLRGFATWPGAFLYVQIGDGDGANVLKVKILETRVLPDLAEEATDIIQVGPTKKSGLYVVCHDRSILEVLRLQPATRKAFRARDLPNGYPGQTIRWVPTPGDQKANPEKYNSRG